MLESGWVDGKLWMNRIGWVRIVRCLRVVPCSGWGLHAGISIGPAGVVIGPGVVGRAGFVGCVGWVVGWNSGAWVVRHVQVCFLSCEDASVDEV